MTEDNKLPPGIHDVTKDATDIKRDEHGCILSAVIKGRVIYFGCMLES